MQLPDDGRGPADERDAECRGDEAAAEPVIDLAAIEKDFKCSRAEADEKDARGVDLQAAAGSGGLTFHREGGRVLHQPAA